MPKKKVFDSDEEDFPQEEADVSVEEESDAEQLLASDSGSDSDGAPEEESFTAGRKQALEKVKATMLQIQQEKLDRKHKRKQKEELYKEQKKQRLERLAASKLPDDILDSLESKALKTKPEKKATSDGENDEGAESEDLAPSGSDDDETAANESLDYIPLSSNDEGIQAVCIKDHNVLTDKSSRQAATDFRKDRLYGKKINRQPAQMKWALQKKRKARLM